MALSYNLGYQESISVHPTRRQIFAGKPYPTFPNIWEWLIYRPTSHKAFKACWPLTIIIFTCSVRMTRWSLDSCCMVTGGFQYLTTFTFEILALAPTILRATLSKYDTRERNIVYFPPWRLPDLPFSRPLPLNVVFKDIFSIWNFVFAPDNGLKPQYWRLLLGKVT